MHDNILRGYPIDTICSGINGEQPSDDIGYSLQRWVDGHMPVMSSAEIEEFRWTNANLDSNCRIEHLGYEIRAAKSEETELIYQSRLLEARWFPVRMVKGPGLRRSLAACRRRIKELEGSRAALFAETSNRPGFDDKVSAFIQRHQARNAAPWAVPPITPVPAPQPASSWQPPSEERPTAAARARPPATEPKPAAKPVKIAVVTNLSGTVRPNHLFTPRPIPPSGIPRLKNSPGHEAAGDRIYLPVAGDRVEQALKLGARSDERGLFVERGDDLSELQSFLPFIARDVIEPLQGDLIPETSYGASLANLLTKSSWDILRMPLVERQGGRCILCGGAGSGALDCHEVWEYWEPATNKQGDAGVQRLAGLLGLCQDCHLVFHIGYARVTGREPFALERLRLINRWSRAEVSTFNGFNNDLGVRRSNFLWVLDVGRFAPERTLIVRGGGTGWRMDEDFDLHREDSRGWSSQTALLGCRFGFRGQKPIGPRDPADWYADCLDPRAPQRQPELDRAVGIERRRGRDDGLSL